jgi:hypothetical protein
MQLRCGKVYGRHSNSLDTSKKVCGRCHGHLLPLGRFRADGTPAKTRAASAFSLFVKVSTPRATSSTTWMLHQLQCSEEVVTAGVYVTVFKRMPQPEAAQHPAECRCVQENFATTKAAAGAHTPHRDVMKALAELWKQQKQPAQVKEVAPASTTA